MRPDAGTRIGLPSRASARPWARIILLLVALGVRADVRAQANRDLESEKAEYGFRVAVDEVSLTFHAADLNGHAVDDLGIEELKLLDNGNPPQRILVLFALKNRALRAGIFMDTSESMWGHVGRDRAIADAFAQRHLREGEDQSLLMEFAYVSAIAQTWTKGKDRMAAAISTVAAGRQNILPGTALFDAVFRACYHEFERPVRDDAGNFILLFSDGNDNASHTSLQEAASTCQRANTTIYAFRAASEAGASTGEGALAELTRETGGRVFYGDESRLQIESDLQAIEAEQRNQYLLVYKPAKLQHDGAFHRIVLLGPQRVADLEVRSGYYAPRQ